jgi:hypothetical protein
LGVVREKVGTGGERPTRDPFGFVVERGGQIRLVVWQIGEHTTLLLDPGNRSPSD